jgi:hypothetical protein
METKALTLFDHLEGLTLKKRPWDANDPMFKKNYSVYMINRFVGMNDSFLPLITSLNEMVNLTDEQHYNFLLKYLPKKKCYFKYVSKIKSVDKEKVAMLMEFYNSSEKDALDYLEIIPAKALNIIFKQYQNQGGVVSKRKTK